MINSQNGWGSLGWRKAAARCRIDPVGGRPLTDFLAVCVGPCGTMPGSVLGSIDVQAVTSSVTTATTIFPIPLKSTTPTVTTLSNGGLTVSSPVVSSSDRGGQPIFTS